MLPGYPKTVKLQTGMSVTLRPMVKEDTAELHTFFCKVPREDRLFLRDDVSLREVVEGWADELNYGRVLPLVAEMGDTIVGDATLHQRRFGWTSHVGKIRIVLGVDYRRQGLGRLMIEELVKIARHAGLELLVAEVMGTQSAALTLLKRLGFEQQAVLPNYVKDQLGDSRDLVVMVKRLEVEPKMVT